MSDVPEQLVNLGPYRLLEKVGEGAAGAVFRAEHDILERDYAVKVVHRRLASNETFRQRFFREARLAARLDHPNIVGVVTADSDGTHYYLVMEYVRGRSLDDLMQNGPLAVRRGVEYVAKVLAGLEYAHDQGMLHRDVKAGNVLVSDDDVPKLTDFGLVVDVNEGSDLTAQGAVVGTPYYMAPEQWRGDEELDARADVFAAGVLLYHLLSAAFPFPGDSPIKVMYRLNQAPADALEIRRWGAVEAARRDRLERRLVSIVDTALKRRRDERFQSAARFRSALEEWLEDAAEPQGELGDADTSSTNTEFPSGPQVRMPNDDAKGDSMPPHNNVNLSNDYVEIAEDTYWVGKRPEGEIFYANPYLCTFPGKTPDDQDFNLLIDPGSSKDFSVVQSKVSRIIGDIKNVNSVFINHQDPDVGSSVGLMLGRYTPDAPVLCTEDTWRLVHYYNIPRKQFVPVEKYPRGMKVPSGHVIQPVPSPFCHFVGAMMLYDPQTRVLFSGDLFGGLTDRDAEGLYADESDWTGMRAFHQIYMPTQTALQNAIDNIRQLDPPVEMIAPQHGRVIRGEYVQEYMQRLYNLPVGLDVLDDRNASEEELQAWTTVLSRVIEVASSSVGGERVEQLLEKDPNLSGHITFQGGEPTVQNFGKTSVERAVRLLCDEVPHATANSIKYEVVFAAEELGLPTPQVELDEDGADAAPEDSGGDVTAHFGVA